MHSSAVACESGSGPSGGREASLLCRAGSSLCALPLGRVLEIMRILPIEPIANAPLFVFGLSIIRGMPTPIVDTALLCSGRSEPPHRLVTVSAGARIIALAVDAVLAIRSIQTNEPMPPLLRGAANDMVAAIGRLDTDLLLFLNAVQIVPEELFERLGNREAVA
jgi:purine-binding chemotaxis protein CheW